MPFLQVDETNDPLGPVGAALPAATLVVQPDKILQLKRRLETRRDKIREFMTAERENLVNVPPPGTDPCSTRAVEALSQNGRSALDATTGFVVELTNTIDALDEAARLYGLVEESNVDRFQQGLR